jgi:PAN domain
MSRLSVRNAPHRRLLPFAWVAGLAALAAAQSASAACSSSERPGTPTNVTMEAISSHQLRMYFTSAASGQLWYDMYLDYEGGKNTGRNRTGSPLELDRVVSRGERLWTVWSSLQPNTVYCGALRARTASGKAGCVSPTTSNWACARTLAADEPPVEARVDRPGGDLFSFSTGNAGSEQTAIDSCSAACSRDVRCRAWTWVKPGVQGPYGKCWLKQSVPNRVVSDCCTSGVTRR